jgi:hypothetical protein
VRIAPKVVYIGHRSMNEVLTIGIPTLAVLVGILVNNSRLGDLRAHVDTRFDDLKSVMDARFEAAHSELIRVEQVMDARLRHLEEGRS